MKELTSIYIYNEDLQKLMAMATWSKFKKWSYADMIEWILNEDRIGDIIHSNLSVSQK